MTLTGRTQSHLASKKVQRSSGATRPSGAAWVANQHANVRASMRVVVFSPACSNRRMGLPEEIAKVALFLASDDASFATGAPFVIDAGWTVS